jgi:hypothetical protein
MVEVIVTEIGTQVKKLNPYFDNFSVNAIQMPNGQVLKNFYGDEPEGSGISDCEGIAFYIRIEPRARVSKNTKRFTSESSSFIARQTCYLVAFAFEHPKEIDSEKWVDKLAKCLLNGVDLSLFAAGTRIEVTEKNASHIDNFLEETKKKFNVEKKFNCVRVAFDILYSITEQQLNSEECDYCDIFKAPC